MISQADLAALQSFDSHGGITLSVYLQMDTPERRSSAYDELKRQALKQLKEGDPQPACREAIKEDMEIVGLYLRTNGHRRHSGLAIFSCAAELFWRAYPLPTPLRTQITIGPQFNIEPLKQLAR